MKEKLLPGTSEVGEFSGLTALVLYLFLNVTSVREAWHGRAATALEPRVSLIQEKPSYPLHKGFGGWFLTISAPCFLFVK